MQNFWCCYVKEKKFFLFFLCFEWTNNKNEGNKHKKNQHFSSTFFLQKSNMNSTFIFDSIFELIWFINLKEFKNKFLFICVFIYFIFVIFKFRKRGKNNINAGAIYFDSCRCSDWFKICFNSFSFDDKSNQSKENPANRTRDFF